jgi:hypothetical protein
MSHTDKFVHLSFVRHFYINHESIFGIKIAIEFIFSSNFNLFYKQNFLHGTQ